MSIFIFYLMSSSIDNCLIYSSISPLCLQHVRYVAKDGYSFAADVIKRDLDSKSFHDTASQTYFIIFSAVIW